MEKDYNVFISGDIFINLDANHKSEFSEKLKNNSNKNLRVRKKSCYFAKL